ncbi:hypothetical protein CMO89_01490, partial [Candidatus Woesearchaeota archaeon]|nr:hypothetical protein [Candidatus Woesearchaeota archaeon]
TDNAGNVQTVVSRNIQLDKTAPTTTDDAPTGWQGADFDITLTPADTGGSGLASTAYCVDTADSCTPATAYTAPVTISTEASQYFRYQSTDNAGNAQTIVSRNVQLDKSAPAIGSFNPAAGSTVSDTKRPLINASLSDGLSGIDISSVEIAVNGIDVTASSTITTTEVRYTPTSDLADGTITVEVNASDNSGNALTGTSWSFTLGVNDPPVIDSYIPVDLTPSVNEGKSLSFDHTSTDPDGDPLYYEWLLDGVLQATTQSWLYEPDFNSEGYRNVTLRVNDTEYVVSQEWNVSVVNITRNIIVNNLVIPDSYIFVNNEYNFTTNVTNDADTIEKNVVVKFLVDGSEADSYTIPSLSEFTTEQVTFAYTFTATGNKEINVSVDARQDESSIEDNYVYNLAGVNVQRPSDVLYPVLSIPKKVQPDGNATAVVDIWNFGGKDISDVPVSLYYDTALFDMIESPATMPIPSIADGTKATVTYKLRSLGVGTTWTDSSMYASAFNDANSSLEYINTSLPSSPILSTSIGLPPFFPIGATLDIPVYVFNTGNETAHDTIVEITLSSGLSTIDPLIKSAGDIDADDFRTVTWPVTVGATGPYTITANATSDDGDYGDSDTSGGDPLSEPQLNFTSIIMPENVTTDAATTVTAVIENQGTEAAAGVSVSLTHLPASVLALTGTTRTVSVGIGEVRNVQFSINSTEDATGLSLDIIVEHVGSSYSKTLSKSFNSIPSGADVEAPTFYDFEISPNPAKDERVTIKFTASEELTANPSVLVDSNAATFSLFTNNRYTYYYDVTTSDPEGDVLVNVTGTDLNSNTGSADTTLTIDYTAPVISSVSGDLNFVNSGSLITITAEEGNSDAGLTGTIVVSKGAVTYINNAPITNEGNGNYSYQWDTTGYPSGAYDVSITLDDGVQQDSDSSLSITLDNPPAISLNYPVGVEVADADNIVKFNYTASDEISVSSCTLWTNFSGVWLANETDSSILNDGFNYFNVESVSNGAYIWNVQCTDGWGYSGWASNNASFTVNFIDDAPTVSILQPSDGENFTAEDTVNFMINANDPEGEPLTITYDFGDGNTTQLVDVTSISHVYPVNDTYIVNVTVDDGSSTASDSITVNILPHAFNITNIKTFNDTFVTEDSVFFRNETVYVSFDVVNRYNPSEFVPDAISTVYLRNNETGHNVSLAAYDNGADIIDGEPFPIANGSYYYSLENLPLVDDILGWDIVFVFSYTMAGSGQGESVIQVLNNPLVFSDLPDISFIENTYNDSLDLDVYVSDVETLDENIVWSFTGNDNVSVIILSDNRVNFTAAQDWFGNETVYFTANDTDGSVETKSLVVEVRERYNTAPIADVGNDLVGFVDVTVALNGSNSSDSEGDIITFNWTQLSGPTDVTGQASFVATSATPSFIPPLTGTYEFQLIVYDGRLYSAPATVSVYIDVENAPPTADTGPNQPSVLVGQQVTLDGSGSYDPDIGDSITYSWSQVLGPVTVTLLNPTTVNPSFTATTVGTYEFELNVTDTNGASDTDNIVIIISEFVNTPPTADAGADQVDIEVGSLVTLDGSGSSDPDGDPITYSWELDSGPTTVGLLNSTTASPSFTAPMIGDYIFSLIVNDGQVNSSPDTVSINVISTANHAPVAYAGANQEVFVNAMVTLDGSSSYDPDGDAITSYSWSQVSGPVAVLSDSAAISPTFTATEISSYVFQLIVSDGQLDSTPVTVTIKVKEAPKPVVKKEQKLEIPSIRLPAGDFYFPGESMNMRFGLENKGNADIKDLRINAMLMDTNIFASTGAFDVRRGRTVSKSLYLDIPDDIEPGDYYIRIGVGNPNVRKVKYRLITIE